MKKPCMSRAFLLQRELAAQPGINGGRTAFLTAPSPQADGMLEGGVPIIVDGHVVGAVGVSGVKSTEDAQIAKAGIAAVV